MKFREFALRTAAAAVSCAAALALCSGCDRPCMDSNRCDDLDWTRLYTEATVRRGAETARYEVVAWKDYRYGQVMLWVKDPASRSGVRAIYTALSNVVLENPDPPRVPAL